MYDTKRKLIKLVPASRIVTTSHNTSTHQQYFSCCFSNSNGYFERDMFIHKVNVWKLIGIKNNASQVRNEEEGKIAE